MVNPPDLPPTTVPCWTKGLSLAEETTLYFVFAFTLITSTLEPNLPGPVIGASFITKEWDPSIAVKENEYPLPISPLPTTFQVTSIKSDCWVGTLVGCEGSGIVTVKGLFWSSIVTIWGPLIKETLQF